MSTGARDPRMRSGERRRLIKAAKQPGASCWVCGGTIDTTLKRGDPASFTLDEIIPRSSGGDPLDPNNTKPAHLSCNSRRGGRLSAATRRQRVERSTVVAVETRDADLW
jgi:5-methylcytosine-specific restriction endonuclease McrA